MRPPATGTTRLGMRATAQGSSCQCTGQLGYLRDAVNWLVLRKYYAYWNGASFRVWHEKPALTCGIECGSLRVRSEVEGRWKDERHEAGTSATLDLSRILRRHHTAPMRPMMRERPGSCRWCWQLGSQRRSPSQLREARGSMLPALGSFQDPACPTDACGNSHIVHSHLALVCAFVRLRACDGTHLSMSCGCR
jgi:hypothetical protein